MKKKKYSETIANVIKSYLIEDEWKFSFDKETGIFKFGLSLKSRIKNIYYIVDVKEDEYIVYAISPIGADEEDEKKMAKMADFICRANYGLKNGNFELDMDDGEIRFKCYVDCDGIIPTMDMVETSIHCPAAMFKRYGDGIVNIIFSDISAKEAVEKCEIEIEEEILSVLEDLVSDDTEGVDDSIVARISEQLGVTNGKEDSSIGLMPEHLKTDLFGTEGDDE